MAEDNSVSLRKIIEQFQLRVVTPERLKRGGVGIQTFALFCGKHGTEGTAYQDGVDMQLNMTSAANPAGEAQEAEAEAVGGEADDSVAGLEEGGPLERIFRPLGLMDLPWEQLSETDEIVLDGVPHRLTEFSYPIGNALRLSGPDVTEEEYAHVMEPYKNGSWRLPAGDLLVQALAAQINGAIRRRSPRRSTGPSAATAK